MRNVFAVLVLFFGAVAVFRAQPAAGTVVVGTSVTATVGTGSTAMVCVISNPAMPVLHTICTVGGAPMLTQDAGVALGAANGIVGSTTNAGNTITWTIQQLTAGAITWSIAANGTAKSGTF